MDFQPVDYDASELPPEAAPGEYEAKCEAVKVTATQKDKAPMLVIDWKLTSAGDDANEPSVGGTVAQFLTFFDRKHKAYKMSCQNFAELCDAIGVDVDIIPKRLSSKNDFRDLIDTLKGKEITVWVTHRVDKQTGENRVGISLKAPRSNALNGKAHDDDDDDAPRGKTTAKNKKGRR
jgi:hypothetical protein